MVGNFHMPPVGYGPGSQPLDEDGKELEYMPMPQDMRAYSSHIPDIETPEQLAPALSLLADIAQAAQSVGENGGHKAFDLSGLDERNRALIAETMGEGEVAIKLHGVPAIAVQESVFAGVWLLKGVGVDTLEVGSVPTLAQTRAFTPRIPALGAKAPRQAGVVNAPPLLAELLDKSAGFCPGDTAHVVNLTLLPHTEEDLAWLDSALGQGSVDILSRGYGNCRIVATAQPFIWRVRFYNSMDTLILDTFEVTGVPEVAIAAQEDLIDSAARIGEILEAIK